MKNNVKYLSCLLALILALSCLTSCKLWSMTMDYLKDVTEEESSESYKEQTAYGMAYDLTDADKAAFEKALDTCLSLIQSGAETSVIDLSVEKIESLFYRISDQADLAYILFCMDQEDAVASENYLYASEMKSDVYADYMKMCQKIDASSYPYRDRFFEDWSESDFLEMRQYTDEVSAINKVNDEILVSYRELDPESDSFAADVCRLYASMVQNNQNLASLFGYADYVSYAYDVVYERDYTQQELTALRTYVQTYLVPLCKTAYDIFLEGYQSLNTADQFLLSSWIYDDYDDFTGDPVGAYLSSLPTEMGQVMKKALQSEYAVFTNDQNAYEGAFTGYFYGNSYPVCYFGPGYQSVFTVIHEAGHFYAADCQGGLDIDLDLAELHSQGNEWLMTVYSKNLMSAELYEVMCAYKLFESLGTIIIGVIIDEFEEMVYTNATSLLGNVEQLDGFMAEVCARYGGEEFLSNYVTDMSLYWKYVVIESPVYYISYSISAISALTLYSEAIKDYEGALEIYQSLAAGELIEDAFLANLEQAGLASPFDEKVYQAISKLIQ